MGISICNRTGNGNKESRWQEKKGEKREPYRQGSAVVCLKPVHQEPRWVGAVQGLAASMASTRKYAAGEYRTEAPTAILRIKTWTPLLNQNPDSDDDRDDAPSHRPNRPSS